MINNDKYFNEYVRNIVKEYSNESTCKLCKVVSYDNQFVEVECVNTEGGVLKQIPIIASKYVRPFIQQGDLGLLLNIRGNIFNYLINEENMFTQGNGYVYAPLISKDEIVVGNNNGNNMIITSPDSKNTIDYSNKGKTSKLVKKSENIDTTLDSISKGNVTIESKALLSLLSSKPIVVKTGENLGSLLVEILNTLSTAIQQAGVPIIIDTYTGGGSSKLNAGVPSSISTLNSQIARLKKILA